MWQAWLEPRGGWEAKVGRMRVGRMGMLSLQWREGRSGFSWLCPAVGQTSGLRVSSQNVKSLNHPEVPPGQPPLPNSIFALPAPLPSEL